MDEIKYLSNSHNILQISRVLQKLTKAIEKQKKELGKVELSSNELNSLKEQCLSKNTQLSLLSCQTLFNFIENGIIDPANGLTMFITMLSGARFVLYPLLRLKNCKFISIWFSLPQQITAIGEGIVNILLLDLKAASIVSKSKNIPYVCPFGLKAAQHPIISLLQKKDVNTLNLAGKINGIHNHPNEQ